MKIRTRFKIAKFLNFLRSRARFLYEFIIILFVFWNSLESWFKKKNGVKDDSQHYLPKFLQRKFEINNNSRKGWVYVYNRGAIRPEAKAIKSVGEETNYYISRNRYTKNWENTYDSIYTFLEDAASPIINHLNTTSELNLDLEEENILAEFIGALYTRTPSFRSQAKHMILYLMERKNMPIESLSKRKIFENIFTKNSLNVNWQEVQDYKPQKISDILNAPNHLISISSFVSQIINEQIFKKTLTILESENPFILSDSAVVVVDFKRSLQWPPLWDFKSRDLIVALPISPKRCIVYGHSKHDLKIIKDEDLAQIINDHSFYYAQDFIISNLESERILKYFNSTKKLHSFTNT